MGWYLRKAISFGPLRLNLSKSGVGVSAGVKGLRVSQGPRGTHLHAGRHGLYFRERLDGGRQTAPSGRRPEPTSTPGVSELREISSTDVGTLIGPGSKQLVELLTQRYRRVAMLPFVVLLGLVGVCGTAGLAATGSAWWWLAFVVVTFCAGFGSWFVHQWDLERKTVQIDYDMDEDEGSLWVQLQRRLSGLADCRRTWQRTAEGDVHDRKRNAGASTVIKRQSATIRNATPPYFKSNVTPVAMVLKGQTLYWTPRYILVYQGGRVGLVRHAALDVSLDTTRFIEEGSVPGDALVVDRTWRYVNKSGGPDRRFSNNREIPVCLYGEVTLRSSRGLHVELMLSRADAADGLPDAVAALAKHVEQVQSQPQPDATESVAIVFNCHGCGKRYRVRRALQGKSAKCTACGASLIVPRPLARDA